jgi:hypothetical protein
LIRSSARPWRPSNHSSCARRPRTRPSAGDRAARRGARRK